ncbi:MAG: flagellar basal body P-ring protein FlgI [Phycisphaerales bacterium]
MPRPSQNSSVSVASVVGAALLMCGAAVLIGCESGPPPKAREVRVISRDVPAVLRNTVGAEASLSGDEPIIMTGYGLVVGLNNTGSNDVPLPVRTYMIDEMTRMGVGKERGSLAGMTPDRLLDDPNVAVVLVQTVIPPGAPKGFKFDARVDAVPGSSTRSLEGGTLWTTELRRGIVGPGGPVTPSMARVYGQVFTNPFAAPGGGGVEPTDSRTGFVLSGGTLTNPWPLTLILDNPSHSRARAFVSAINARYGRGVARGKSEDTLEVTIPDQYRDKPGIFASLLKHTRIEQGFPEEAAQRYLEALREQPELANELSWCLAALGESAIPFVRRLYTDAEMFPRLAALQAGARLGDLTTRPHLEALVNAGPSPTRPQMLELLASLPHDPKVDAYFRGLLDAPDMDVRVAAYEALSERKDPVIKRTTVAGKFDVDRVPSDEPMVYVTQSKTPRIVLFGGDLPINRPALVSAWDGRLMLDAPATGSKARVFYKSDRPGVPPASADVEPTVTELIQLVASKPGPENPLPGFDFSYSQTVSALHQMVQAGAVGAPIVPEQDKLALEMLRARREQVLDDRPELSESGPVEELTPVADRVQTVVAPTDPEVGAAKGAPGEAAIREPTRPLDEAREKQRKKYVVPVPSANAEKPKPKK